MTRAPRAALLQKGAGLQQVGSAPWGPMSGSRGSPGGVEGDGCAEAEAVLPRPGRRGFGSQTLADP